MKPQRQETGLDGVVTEVSLGLLAQRGDKWHPSGSAVVIAPRLAITARHVIDDHWREFGQEHKLKWGDLHGDFGLLAQQVLPGKRGSLWCVRRIWLSPHSDLAAIQLSPYSQAAANYRWRTPILQFLPPAVGSVVYAFGYRGGEVATSADVEGVSTRVQWATSPSTASGSVLEVHDERRDSRMYCFPCFRTDAPFAHGMSGGPIFSEGRLVGIVCGSLPAVHDADAVSYGATLWPLLALKIEARLQGDGEAGWCTVFDLARRGLVHSHDLSGIRVSPVGTEMCFEAPRRSGSVAD